MNMNIKFVNLTPHEITVVNSTTRIFPKSDKIARVSQTVTVKEVIDDIEIGTVSFGQVVDLPEPVDGVFFIVSALVKSAVTNRTDLLSPGELVRNTDGIVIGCKRFFA